MLSVIVILSVTVIVVAVKLKLIWVHKSFVAGEFQLLLSPWPSSVKGMDIDPVGERGFTLLVPYVEDCWMLCNNLVLLSTSFSECGLVLSNCKFEKVCLLFPS